MPGFPDVLSWRDKFDRWSKGSHSYRLVAGAAAVTGAALWWMQRQLGAACSNPPVSIIRLETAFTAEAFKRFLLAEGACAAPVVASFFWDILFALAYGFLLAALYLWAERWRRYGSTLPASARAITDPKVNWRARLVLRAALVAPLLDVVEDVFLLAAGSAVSTRFDWLVGPLVRVGSIASVGKWVLLIVWAWGTISELIAGPRGRVLWRVRFSVLAVALGGLPLLLVPQGQDMLRRMVEAGHPYLRAFSVSAALTFAAFAVWRCARTLVRFEFKAIAGDDEEPGRERVEQWSLSTWGAFYAEHIPRLMAGALLVIGAAALANEAGDLPLMLLAGLVGSLGAALLSREPVAERPGFTERIGNFILRFAAPRWRLVPELGRRIGESIILLLPLTVLVLARILGWRPDGDDDPLRAILDLAALWCVAASCALTLYVYFRRGVDTVRQDRTAKVTSRMDQAALAAVRKQLDFAEADKKSYNAVPIEEWRKVIQPVVATILVSVVVLLLFTFYPVAIGRTLGPIWILSIFVANTVFFGSIFVVVHLHWRIPVVRLGLALALLFSVWNDNHRVATLGDRLVRSDTLGPRITRWLAAHDTTSGANAPIVLVAASGGGLRAAYWTAITLAELQDADSTFARDVFAISGVSGGSLGAALFVSLVHDAGPGNTKLASCPPARSVSDTTKLAGPFATCVRGIMGRDFLSPILAMMLAPDLAQRFSPVVFETADRSHAIEDAWSSAYDTFVHQHTFDSGLVELGRNPRLPLLLLNATHVETGRRYIASPVALDSTIRDAGDLLAIAGHDLPLRTAVHNSARFTFVSPAGHIVREDGREAGRLVDGGYFENSGLVTLHEIYSAIHAQRPTAPIMILYLCNDPASCRAREGVRGPDSLTTTASTAANELLAPVRALLHTRDARASLARAQLSRAPGGQFVQFDVCPDSVGQSPIGRPRADSAAARDTTESKAQAKAKQRAISPPLGWVLSGIARDWMDRSIASDTLAGDGACRAGNRSGLQAVRDRRKGSLAVK